MNLLKVLTACRVKYPEDWVDPIASAFKEFGISSDKQRSMFLANALHETGGFKFLREIWGPTPAQSRYDTRDDLGNTKPEAIRIAKQNCSTPGKWWRGRGIFQTTGYDNHLKAGPRLGLDLLNHPDLLEVPANAARSAALFWVDNRCGQLAEAGDFDGVCDRINKGHKTQAIGDSNGYAERLAYYRKIQGAAV